MKAGIPFLDERGCRIDYHALRTTFITRLSTMKVHPRVAMELARHSDMRLTMKAYTDGHDLKSVCCAESRVQRAG
jgi:integrase